MTNLLQKIKPFTPPSFWIIFCVKLLAGMLFASPYMLDGSLPFVHYFANTLLNPYEHFFGRTDVIPFPYPFGMLFALAIPYKIIQVLLPSVISDIQAFQIFALRIPILLFDTAIYFVLCHFLPTKQRMVRWLYYASPILFFINYIHGQLDVIPTALLFISIALLFRKKEALAYVLLGFGIATKTHLLLALPFFALYSLRNNASIFLTIKHSLLSLFTMVALNPYLSSPEFLAMVFNNPEQQRLLSLFIPFGLSMVNGLKFFLAPAALLLVFFRFLPYKKLNNDSLLLILGLAFTILIALVPPMPGWFYWSIPFLTIFFIKYKNAPLISMWAMNVFFILYVLLTPDLEVLKSLGIQFNWDPLPVSSFFLWSIIAEARPLLQNLSFTALETTLIVNLFWTYIVGMKSNKLFQQERKNIFIGIGGDSGMGKSTLGNVFSQLLGRDQVAFLNGDDAHKWERGHRQWNVLTHLNPSANYVHAELAYATALIHNETIERKEYDHSKGTFTEQRKMNAHRFIIAQGLHPFFLEEMRRLYDFKIYVEAEEQLRKMWKLNRDGKERGYSQQEIDEQIERRKPDAEKFIKPQREFADWIIHYSMDESKKLLNVQYFFRNSIFIDVLMKELCSQKKLKIEDVYLDMNYRRIFISGLITKETLRSIAYKLFPDTIQDFIGREPIWENNASGLNQIFFLNFLHNYYRMHERDQYIS